MLRVGPALSVSRYQHHPGLYLGAERLLSAFCKDADPEIVATRGAGHKLWRQPLAVDLEGSPNVALNEWHGLLRRADHRWSSSVTQPPRPGLRGTDLAAYLHVALHLDAHGGSGQANGMF